MCISCNAAASPSVWEESFSLQRRDNCSSCCRVMITVMKRGHTLATCSSSGERERDGIRSSTAFQSAWDCRI